MILYSFPVYQNMFEESNKNNRSFIDQLFFSDQEFSVHPTIVQQYALQKSKWSKIYAKDIKRVTVFQFQLFVL